MVETPTPMHRRQAGAARCSLAAAALPPRPGPPLHIVQSPRMHACVRSPPTFALFRSVARRHVQSAAVSEQLPLQRYDSWAGLQEWRASPVDDRLVWGAKDATAAAAASAARPPPPLPLPPSLAECGRAVLLTAEPLAKAALTHAAWHAYTAGALPLGAALAPAMPARPAAPALVPPRDIPPMDKSPLPKNGGWSVACREMACVWAALAKLPAALAACPPRCRTRCCCPPCCPHACLFGIGWESNPAHCLSKTCLLCCSLHAAQPRPCGIERHRPGSYPGVLCPEEASHHSRPGWLTTMAAATAAAAGLGHRGPLLRRRPAPRLLHRLCSHRRRRVPAPGLVPAAPGRAGLRVRVHARAQPAVGRRPRLIGGPGRAPGCGAHGAGACGWEGGREGRGEDDARR